MKAFTLVEVLVSSVIFIGVMLAVLTIFQIGDQSWQIGSGMIELQQQARLAIDGMAREIRQADTTTDGITITLEAYGSRIEFYIKDKDSPIKYYLNNENQIIREYDYDGNGTIDSLDLKEKKILANNIVSLNFDNSVDIVEISLQAGRETNNRQLYFPSETGEIIGKVRLRNE